MSYRLLFSLFFIAQLHAQPSFNPAIPSPRQILGYELGDKFTSHAGIERYLKAVHDATPGSTRLQPYGETYEGRALYLMIMSSPRNMQRLDEIEAGIRKLSDPRTITNAEAERIMSSIPPIAWLSYDVHGNEASCSEAALNVVYQLAARSDTEITSLLENLVVIIDPLLNPDGHERYVNYEITRSGAHPIEDKGAFEHNEDWPSGRTNHYFFDLNRDWAWLTQQESQARVKAYREWKPQVHVDFHEMGYNSSYFFFPAFRPINKNFPKSTVEWGTIYGRANAAAFDKLGLSYWSGESFDLFYPGYGDSWPSLNGAIGMTYEQAGQTGVRVRRSDETILSLRDRLEHHSIASLATLKATAENREKRLRDFHTFFKEAVEEGRNGPVKSFIVNPGKDPSRAAKMIALLQHEGVEVEQSKGSFALDGLNTYYSKGTVRKDFPAGSYIIPLNQPAKRLIMALMEQEPALSDTFFYDISTWTLPTAYGVETYWTGKAVSVPTVTVKDVELPAGSVIGGKAGYAYLFRCETNDALSALVWLLQNDYRATVAMKEFTIGDEHFPRGTIIVPVGNNGANIHSIVEEAARKFHLAIYSAQSGMTDSGINLGSDRAVRLKRPRIIVATGSPVGTEAFGAIWSMFDQRYGIEFVPMKLGQIRSIDLHDYTAIVFPDDNADGQAYKSQFDSNAVLRLKTWVAAGGTFIGIEGGAAFASASLGKLASVKLKEKKKDDKDAKKDTAKGKLSDEELEKRMTVEERERKSRLESIPGTLMRVKLDGSHPLGFGYDGEIAVLKTTQTMFELSERGYNVGMYTKSPRLSGYISKENEKLLEETPFLVHEQLGAGNIVLFADDPNFRLFFDGLNRVFLNSILLMPSIRNVTLTAGGE